MNKQLLLVPCVAIAGLLLSSCAVDEYDDDRRSAYHQGGSADFYYTSGRPYSRSYGPLSQRDGRYYYSRGGNYVVYDRPTTVYRADTRVVRRDVDVRRSYDDDDRRDYDDRRRVYSRPDDDDDRRYDGSVRRTDLYRSEGRPSGIRGETGTRVRIIER